jgi:hypothetical protein
LEEARVVGVSLMSNEDSIDCWTWAGREGERFASRRRAVDNFSECGRFFTSVIHEGSLRMPALDFTRVGGAFRVDVSGPGVRAGNSNIVVLSVGSGERVEEIVTVSVSFRFDSGGTVTGGYAVGEMEGTGTGKLVGISVMVASSVSSGELAVGRRVIGTVGSIMTVSVSFTV